MSIVIPVIRDKTWHLIGTIYLDTDSCHRMATPPKGRLLGHFTGNCHFIGNMEATSWEKKLGRKLPLHWKQQLKYFTGNCHFIGKIGNYGAPERT